MAMPNSDTKAQQARISAIVMTELGTRYPGVAHAVLYDEAKRRVIVEVGGVNLEFGPDEWGLGNSELRYLVGAKILKVLGAPRAS